jgi:ATP-dependent RNA helicase DOB1
MLPEPPEMARPLPDFSEPPAPGAAPPPPADPPASTSGKGSAAAAVPEGGGGEAVVSEVTHGVWGAVVNFERVGGKKDGGGESIVAYADKHVCTVQANR